MKSELDRVLTNPEHVIISDTLQELLPSESNLSQSLFLDGSEYVCTLKSATLINASTRTWKFVLEVPGIGFQDIAAFPEMGFVYGSLKFSDFQGIEFETSNLETQCVTLVLRQIINLEEAQDE